MSDTDTGTSVLVADHARRLDVLDETIKEMWEEIRGRAPMSTVTVIAGLTGVMGASLTTILFLIGIILR